MKTLTISVAAYNAEAYITKCLNSLIVSEILNDIEVIVVNDGSNDSTEQIVEKYCKKYPQTFILLNKENGGWGSTVNESLKIASGKYYKLLDSDDWFYTKNLSKFVDFLKNASEDLILTPYSMYDDKKYEYYQTINWEDTLENQKNYNYEDIINKIFFGMHGMTVKTDCIKDKINLLKHCFYTDVQYLIQASNYIKTVKYLNLIIYDYRFGRDGQSCSRDGFIKHHLEHKKVIEKSIEFCEHMDCHSNIHESMVKWLNSLIVVQYGIYRQFPKQSRKEYMIEWNKRVKEYYPEYYCMINDKETKLNIKTNFVGISVIHVLFDIYHNIHLKLLKIMKTNKSCN